MYGKRIQHSGSPRGGSSNWKGPKKISGNVLFLDLSASHMGVFILQKFMNCILKTDALFYMHITLQQKVNFKKQKKWD